MVYRSELKYFIDSNDLVILDGKLKNIMGLDSTAKFKKYNVRSIYFDSYNNKCFYENEDGVNERFKIRIRIYNRSTNDIKLEIKYKKNGFAHKESVLIDKKMCEKLINGFKLNYKECNNTILRKLYLEQQMHLFLPKIMVEYDRIAYVDKIGNTRVTFDTNIRASKYVKSFFDSPVYAKPIMPINMHILEIKYNELFPDYIAKQLQSVHIERTSFSKYYLSRIAFKEEVL